MIKLVKNELFKVFKKKFFIIMILLMIVFTGFTGYMNKKYAYSYMTIDDQIKYAQMDIDYYSKEVHLYPEFKDYYNDALARLEMYKLAKTYGDESWQARVIMYESSAEVLGFLNLDITNPDKESPMYLEAKKSYDEVIKLLNDNDWKAYAKYQMEKLETSDDADSKITKEILQLRLDKNIEYKNNYINTTLQTYEYSKSFLNYYETLSKPEQENPQTKEQYEYYLKDVYLAKYDIDHSTSLNDYASAHKNFIGTMSGYMIFIVMFGVVIAGSILSDEFNKGTIKLLLVKPYSRTKILISKFIAAMICLLIFIIVMHLIQFVVGGIICGFNTYSAVDVIYDYSKLNIVEISTFKSIINNIITLLPIPVLLSTLAFTLATIFPNAAFSIGIAMVGQIASELINMFIVSKKIDFLKYFVTMNWDLSGYLYGGSAPYEGLTMMKSSIICLIYLLIMIVLSIVLFKKKDIKNI